MFCHLKWSSIYPKDVFVVNDLPLDQTIISLTLHFVNSSFLLYFLSTIFSISMFRQLKLSSFYPLIKLSFHQPYILSTRHFINFPFCQLDNLQINKCFSLAWQFQCLSTIIIINFTSWSNYHFINLTFCLLVISSTLHFVNLSFHQLVISSTCHFINLSFHQLSFLSTLQFTNQCMFFQLNFHQ